MPSTSLLTKEIEANDSAETRPHLSPKIVYTRVTANHVIIPSRLLKPSSVKKTDNEGKLIKKGTNQALVSLR